MQAAAAAMSLQLSNLATSSMHHGGTDHGRAGDENQLANRRPQQRQAHAAWQRKRAHSSSGGGVNGRSIRSKTNAGSILRARGVPWENEAEIR
jgi:hypothetical protein